VLQGGAGRPLSLSFSPDGRWLAAVFALDARGREGRLWEVATKREERFPGAAALAFSPRGERLAGGEDKQISLLDPATGERQLLKGHGGAITALAFSRDGAFLASASSDQTVLLWNTATGEAFPVRSGGDPGMPEKGLEETLSWLNEMGSGAGELPADFQF